MSESRPLFTWESLEGEYTTWVPLWNVDTFALGVPPRAVWVDNFGTVYVDDTGGGIVVLNRAGANVVDLSRSFQLVVPCEVCSVSKKYMMTENLITATIFHVYRRGVAIFQRNVTADQPLVTAIRGFAFSASGRYIAVIGMVGVAFRYVLLYEGR